MMKDGATTFLLFIAHVVSISVTTRAFLPPIQQNVNVRGQRSKLFSESSSSSCSRRDFITTTGAKTLAGVSTAAAGAGGAFLYPPPAGAVSNPISGNKTPLSLPPMGLGAWAWGDSVFWGYDRKQDGDLREVFDYALNKNLAFFDTAELYGIGRSETLLGEFRSATPPADQDKVIIATKFAALPWRTSPSAVISACEASTSRLKAPIDLYQIHFPNAWANEAYWDGLAQCYERGLVRGVGVSNYGVDATRKIHGVLKERGIPLVSNQIQLSLLYKWPLENGLIQTCRELGVDVLAYSPLALGFLTGKYNRDNLPSGPRKTLGEKLFEGEGYNTLLKEMKSIAAKHEGEVSQVALNWCRAKGSIPIPGARNLKQVQQNLAALDWDLTKEEVESLDEIVARIPPLLSPDKSPFAKEDIGTGLKMFDS